MFFEFRVGKSFVFFGEFLVFFENRNYLIGWGIWLLGSSEV